MKTILLTTNRRVNYEQNISFSIGKRSRTKHRRTNQVCTTNKIWSLGTGFHGTNGIDPITAYQIYKTYVLPRLLYGLEILPLTRTQINLLEGFHWKSIRYMQSLPQRNTVSAVYLLIGAYPVEAEIHLRQLSLLYSLLSCHNGRIKEDYDNTKSFFCHIRKTLEIYELPKIHELQSNLHPKPKWKNLVKNIGRKN